MIRNGDLVMLPRKELWPTKEVREYQSSNVIVQLLEYLVEMRTWTFFIFETNQMMGMVEDLMRVVATLPVGGGFTIAPQLTGATCRCGNIVAGSFTTVSSETGKVVKNYQCLACMTRFWEVCS